MKVVRTPHDKFFKAALSDVRVAKDFLQTYLFKEIRSLIDFDALKLQPTSYVDQSLKTVISDILYKAKLKGEAGEDVYIYLLCEHQSTDDPLMAFRIWQYVINIWADIIKQTKDKKLPLIVPLVFYSGEKAFKGSTDLRDLIQAPKELIDKALFNQSFQLIDINTIPDDELKQSQWAGMMALIMKHVRDRDILLFLKEILSSLKHLETEGGTGFVQLLLNYCLNTGETLNIQEFVSTVQQGLSQETGEKVMTIAEQLKAEARAEGEAKGKAEAIKAIAINGFKNGLTISMIQQLTGLSEQELKVIEKLTLH